jgi:hypothetical protein
MAALSRPLQRRRLQAGDQYQQVANDQEHRVLKTGSSAAERRT